MTISKAVAFYLKDAGWVYNPTMTRKDKLQYARTLARAEREAFEGGFFYHWSVDPEINSSYFSDDTDPWKLWQCSMYNKDGKIVNSLHGIDFGRGGQPWGNNYRRVVEAELAIEGLTNTPQ